MKKLLIVTFCLLAFSGIAQTSDETSTYYFIRHAEKNRSNPDNKNPNLTKKGYLRAAKWSYVLENVKFDAVYSTDYNRTIQTATPTAEKQKIDITLYNPSKLDIKTFLEKTKGQNVLVVGHSNTTPMFVNAILEKETYPEIKDNNNANLYIVTVSKSGEKSASLIVVD